MSVLYAHIRRHILSSARRITDKTSNIDIFRLIWYNQRSSDSSAPKRSGGRKGGMIMYCKNCGSAVEEGAAICTNCGVPVGQGTNFCANCGSQLQQGAAVCMSCGFAANGAVKAPPVPGAKSKMAAGLLGIFLGGYGVHNFYLGYTGKAVAQLSIALGAIILSAVSCGFLVPLAFITPIWGLVEGIMILTGSIKTDAKGVPLAD